MSFCGLKKGISLKICIELSVSYIYILIINKRSFESLMCSELIDSLVDSVVSRLID